MKDIGVRAAKEVYNRQNAERSLDDVLDEIGSNRQRIWSWHNRKANPSAYCLRIMALAGYDVYYILIGERK